MRVCEGWLDSTHVFFSILVMDTLFIVVAMSSALYTSLLDLAVLGRRTRLPVCPDLTKRLRMCAMMSAIYDIRMAH